MPILGITASSILKVTSSYESIASVTANGSQTTVTFSSIPATYKHLQIRFIGRSLRNGVSDNLGIYFNSDQTTNYATHYLRADGGTAVSSADINATETFLNESVRASGTSNTLTNSVAIIDILDYTSTSKNKTIRSFSGWDFNGSGYVVLGSGLWRKTPEAINSIVFNSGGNAFSSTSTFALYGIKG